MNRKQLISVTLIAFFVGAVGSIAVSRFLIPYTASVTGWQALNKLVTSSPIVVNRREEIFLNDGVNLIELAKQAGNFTVTLYSKDANPTFLGNGIILTSDGLIFTSKTILAGKTELVVLTNNGNSYKASVRAVDPKSDLAAITINEKNLNTPTFASSLDLQVGQRVLTIGESNTAFTRSFMQGYVINSATNYKSSLWRTYSTEVLEDFFETDAAINTGRFAGSPLINLEGKLVGMVTASAAQKIVTAENLQTALASYLADGKIVRPRLGLSYFQLSKSLATLRGFNRSGILVAQTNAASPAAGKFLTNDLIFEVDGQNVENQSFEQLINRHAIGEIKLKLLRNDKEMEVKVNLESTK